MNELNALVRQWASETAGQACPVSDFEQQVWLHHEQCGDSTHQLMSAFRLSGDIHLSLLLEALTSVLQSLPNLDVRYQLNDDFVLIKQQNVGERPRVTVVQVSDRTEAMQQMLNWQNERIDLAAQPPMDCRLLLGGDELILAVRHHRILADSVNWQMLFSSLSGFYHGELNLEDWSQHCAKALPLAYPVYTREQPLPTAYQWLAAIQQPARSTIEQLGCQRLKTTARRAEKVRASLPVHALAQLTGDGSAQSGPEHQTMLCAAVAAFARFLADVSGEHTQHIFAPAQVTQRHHELNGSTLQSGLRRLTLETMGRDTQALCDQVERQWQADIPAKPLVVDSGDLTALVTWSVDPGVHLRLAQIQCETLRLAPLHSDFDIVVALGISCDHKLLIELTTGERVSPYIASWLLERFTDSLSRTDSLSVPVLLRNHGAEQVSDGEGENTRIATLIAAEFAAALNVENMSLDDDFFDFGGHSLIATRVIGKLYAQHQIEVRINDLFSGPTARALAAHAVCHQSAGEPVSAADERMAADAPVPLSFAQASLWKAYAAFGYNELFNIPFALRFLDPVDERVFEQAFTDVMHRHSVLRTRFAFGGDSVMQHVVPVAELGDYSWFWTSSQTGDADRQNILNQEAGHVFDLRRELPVRLRFVRDLSSGIQYLSFLFHHVVLDEWSVNLLMDDLHLAYAARSRGKSPQWVVQPRPFSEHALRQHQRGFDSTHLDYWLHQFEGVPLDAPLLPGLQNQPGAEPSDAGGWVEFQLESRITQGLYRVARQQGASLFNVVYAAISLTLKQLGAPTKLIIGTPASGRLDAEFFDTVGYFTTLVMHVVHFDRAQTLAELIEQVRNTINQSLDYSDVPIDWVEDALTGGRNDKHHLFEVLIQLHAKNKLHGQLNPPDQAVRFEQVDPQKSESALGLQFEVMEEKVNGEDRVRVLMSYRSDQYGDKEVKMLTNATQRMLTCFAAPDAGRMTLAEACRTEEL